jgi:hypothetical protein
MCKLLQGVMLLVLPASVPADVPSLFAMIGSECFELICSKSNEKFVKQFNSIGMQEGTCSSKGFSVEVPDRSLRLEVPWVRRPIFLRRMQMSSWETAKIKAQAFLAAPLSGFGGWHGRTQKPVREPTSLFGTAASTEPFVVPLADSRGSGFLVPQRDILEDAIDAERREMIEDALTKVHEPAPLYKPLFMIADGVCREIDVGETGYVVCREIDCNGYRTGSCFDQGFTAAAIDFTGIRKGAKIEHVFAKPDVIV